MDTAPALTVTHSSTVTPDQIDELGHMNVRWYGYNAFAGTRSVCDQLGIDAGRVSSTYTRHHHEQMEGNELEIRSGFLDGQRLRIYHELRNRADDDLAATFVHELDYPAVEAPTIELPPHGASRSLRLDADAFARAPAVHAALDDGLAIRRERLVNEEDTDGHETVPPWWVKSLVWGGERFEEEDDWIKTLANGDRFAWVVMETRAWMPPAPVAIGTRIQSFGALVEVQDKVRRSVDWVFDLDTGQPILALEVINLCFNLTERRAISIPDDERSEMLERLRADLAVS